MISQSFLEEFRATVTSAANRLTQLSDTQSEAPCSDGKWSPKQLIGHLIDSASNNHQRFVRGQLNDYLESPGYEQESWVRVQQYTSESWADLLLFWKSYNLHLLHVVEAIPSSALGHRLKVGDNEPVTLEFLVQDYLRHMQHHLNQIPG